MRTAHSIAWEIANNQPVPSGMMICHSCDYRLCCNPAHLFLGTAQDNTDDMIAKDRMRPGSTPGEKNAGAKLTQQQVDSIRNRYSTGNVTYKDLAKEFGVNADSIGSIVRGVTWRDHSSGNAA